MIVEPVIPSAAKRSPGAAGAATDSNVGALVDVRRIIEECDRESTHVSDNGWFSFARMIGSTR